MRRNVHAGNIDPANTVKTAMHPKKPDEVGWQRLRPRTLVDKVIDAVIAGAARGLVLPGDRIIETEIAQRLGISRVPVREALRILESQGVVINEPYKGIRLTPVTPQRVDDLIEARIALETTAATRAIRNGRNGSDEMAVLKRIVDELELMSVRQDAYGFAQADASFHRTMVGFSGNAVLSELWETLSRQLTIIFGLSTFGKAMPEIVEEHRVLMAVLLSGDVDAIARELDDHISVQTHLVDLTSIVDRRRSQRATNK
jgi:DNA-binding GntR family transcriptional regulator